MGNPYHRPGGDEHGGEFTSGPGVGSHDANHNMPKKTSDMTRGQLNKELDRLREQNSKMIDQFIARGQGNVKTQDIFKQTDPLSVKYKEVSTRIMDLNDEKSHRMRYQGSEHKIKKSKFGF